MSDWEDDDRNDKPRPHPSMAKYNIPADDGWDEEPVSKRNDDYSSRKRDQSRDNGRSNNRYMDGNDNGGDQMSFTINKSNVGLVIGRGGSKIKELEQTFHVRLNIGKAFFFHSEIQSNICLLFLCITILKFDIRLLP